MNLNSLYIAAAGSGKTTHLINKALKVDEKEKVLITTFTIENADSIRKRIIDIKKCVPQNITVQTWFSFLLQNGVRPYQNALIEKRVKGLFLIEGGQSAQFVPETKVQQHYFTSSMDIYSDKIAKFVIKSNECVNNAVFDRLSKIYSHIYIDEVQDLAGYDLEIIKLLLKEPIKIKMVGDPRQKTYSTHWEPKYRQYIHGNVDDFIRKECKNINCFIDDETLNKSYRNPPAICHLSSKLYPQYRSCVPNTNIEDDHLGVFILKRKDLSQYLMKYNPMQLRYNIKSKSVKPEYPVLNFGMSKGLEFDRVVIYPTTDMKKWILTNGNHDLANTTKSQLYVALTRARYSVAIVIEDKEYTDVEYCKQFVNV